MNAANVNCASSSANKDSLAREFDEKLQQGVRTLARLGYPARRFEQMLAEHGGVATAIRLVAAPQPSEGLWTLARMNRLDMSVEVWTLLPKYEPLFPVETRDQARNKLQLLGVDVDRAVRSTAHDS